MASRNGKKASGLRMLWIPGGRKGHPKGRFDSTNKHVSYASRQKKSEVWSLGGSKAQNDLLRAEPDVSLLDGPSTSGIATLACATATGTAVSTASNNTDASATHAPSTECSAAVPAQSPQSSSETTNDKRHSNDITTPTTPNSTTSTALLISAPQSPLITVTDLDSIESELEYPSSNTMPAKAHQLEPSLPAIVTTTTTAQIIEDNRFSILGKDIKTNEFDIYTLPSPPSEKDDEHLNSSSGTTASQKSSSASSPHKEMETSSTTESHHHHQHNNGSLNNSPAKKKHLHRNNNNNQGDVNSIESITEDTVSVKIPSGDLDWIDNAIQDRNDREILTKSKKKKKKKISNAKELDQLDGIPIKGNSTEESIKEEDEKVVKCLYYTLMCCDCTIS